ncbi:hypothetical protein F66182_441 [Fusarium sp. NRRL 66182]|nr:hypothetical protein F66182_441 [Fusarium sp. NRRL 66182]
MPNPLKTTLLFLTWALDHDQVPKDIRRSLELVRTCDSDLQHLIELRNDCLPLLGRRPRVLERVHSTIESARQGLEQVCEIVERCRPDANRGGKTPFSKRMAWLLVDSSEFRSQEPIVSRHHAAVLAELNFLRQIALLAPVSEPEKVQQKRGVLEEATVFDNVALLGDILGHLPGELDPFRIEGHVCHVNVPPDLLTRGVTAPIREKPPVPQPAAPSIVIFNAATERMAPSTASSLSPPHTLRKSASHQTLHVEHQVDSLPEVLQVNMAGMAASRPYNTGSKCGNEGSAGLSLLLGDPLTPANCPSPPPSRVDVPGRPTAAFSYGSTTSLAHLQPVCSDSDQYLRPCNPNESVSDLSQSGRHASVSYTPSILSSNSPSPHGHHRSSLPACTATQSFTQHQNASYMTYPGRRTWSTSFSTTASSIPPAYTGSGSLGTRPIAELDSSPCQMVPIDGALDADSTKRKLAKQINMVAVELPAENSSSGIMQRPTC